MGEVHVPYSKVRGHPPDFRVWYRFFTLEEGGRLQPPGQGIRCDFSYAEDNAVLRPGRPYQVAIIHPEFLDDHGEVIQERGRLVQPTGYAYMWILFDEARRRVHRKRITVGTKGYFQEGTKRIAEVEVVEIIGLATRP